ncbi:MAG: FTR1 family protein [Cyanobacteriota bacterium]|nr:FTR1 family protein [Cyanobacteriota bacterium]
MDFSAALPTFIVTLREGFEAALVVGIVLACLKRAQQAHLNRWVYGGVAGGIAASALVGVLFTGLLRVLDTSDRPYALVAKPLLEAGFGILAIALLSWMLVWMTQQARSLKSEVEGAIVGALQQESGAAGWGVFGLIFIAVLREGFETVLFVAAQFQEGIAPALGAIAGLSAAAGMGVLLFRWGIKIDIRRFFQVMGIFLLLIVSGLVVSALKNLEATAIALSTISPEVASFCQGDRASCILGPQVWDLTAILPDKKFPGLLLKSLLGYRDRLFFAQGVGYITFLFVTGMFYFRSLSGGVGRVAKSEP